MAFLRQVVRLAGVFAALVASLTVAPAVGHAAVSGPSALPGLGGEFEAVDVNSAGEIAGNARTTSFAARAVVWRNGTLVDLGSFGGDVLSVAAINDLGWVVGYGNRSPGDDVYNGFLWRNGQFEDLGRFGHGWFNVRGVNTAGDIVGNLVDYAPDGSYLSKAVLLRDGTLTYLFGETYRFNTFAEDINTSGQVAGYQELVPGQRTQGYVWQAGKVTSIGVVPGDRSSYAQGINDSGVVVGYSDSNGVNQHAFRFAAGQLTPLAALGGTSVANDVNDSGLVVGYASVPGTNASHAVLWQGGGAVDLGTLPDSSGYPVDSLASAVNDSGLVVGRSFNTVPWRNEAVTWQVS